MAKIATKSARLENGAIVGVQFDFANGESFTLDFAELTPALRDAALAHGLLQKLGDTYSGAKGNADTAVQMFMETYGNLKDGNWNSGRRGTGGQAKLILAMALAEVAKRTLDEAKERIAEMDDDEIKGLKKNVHIAAAVKRIEAEMAAEAAEGTDVDIDW